MVNRLAGAVSPYLRQHAGYPVDWYPWGAEAFAEARRRDVPVMVSVGNRHPPLVSRGRRVDGAYATSRSRRSGWALGEVSNRNRQTRRSPIGDQPRSLLTEVAHS